VELWDRDYVYSVDAGDLNMDGRTDIAFLNHPPAEHRIWWAEQPAAFGDPWGIDLIETLDDENFGGDAWKVKLADLDRDGMIDVLHNVNNRVYVNWNEMHVGVSEAIAIQPELIIHPNPCGDLCAVKAMNLSEVVVSVRLRSVEGMDQEFSACPTADGYLLDVSRLAAGCYMIDAILDSGKRTVARVLIIR
jgi:FG-GAP-like repeat